MMRENCSRLSADSISLFPLLLMSSSMASLVQGVCFTSRCKTHCNTLLMQPVLSHCTLNSVLRGIKLLKIDSKHFFLDAGTQIALTEKRSRLI